MSLQQKLVVLTRDRVGNLEWRPLLNAQGMRTYCLAAIETELLPLSSTTMRAIRDLSRFDWLIFTSPRAVSYFQQLCERENLHFHTLPQIAVTGPSTESSVNRGGFTVAFRPSQATGAALSVELAPVNDKKILLLRSDIADQQIVGILSRRGAHVSDVALYQTRARDHLDTDLDDLLMRRSVDYLTFASPSAVQGFCRSVSSLGLAKAQGVPTVVLGPSTHRAAARAGFRKLYDATRPSAAGIVAVLRRVA